MKIVITGVTGFRNRGVEALVRPTVEQLKSRYANASIQIVSRSPGYDEQRLNNPHTSYLQDAFYQGGALGPAPLVEKHDEDGDQADGSEARNRGLRRSR